MVYVKDNVRARISFAMDLTAKTLNDKRELIKQLNERKSNTGEQLAIRKGKIITVLQLFQKTAPTRLASKLDQPLYNSR